MVIFLDEPEKLTEDEEVQEFARLLVDEKDGAGMKVISRTLSTILLDRLVGKLGNNLARFDLEI